MRDLSVQGRPEIQSRKPESLSRRLIASRDLETLHGDAPLIQGESMPAADSISKDPIARLVETQGWIDPNLATAAQDAIQSPFRRAGSTGASALAFLHGEWLHQPLHAVLTD